MRIALSISVIFTLFIYSCSNKNESATHSKIARTDLLIHRDAVVIDSLININKLKEALQKTNEIDFSQFSNQEKSYLIYKINKFTFYHNYFYPCDTIAFLELDIEDTNDDLSKSFKLLNEYYADKIFHNESVLKQALTESCTQYHTDLSLSGELLSEIARFYVNEGNNSDSADYYFNLSHEKFKSAGLVSYNNYLTIRYLAYLQIALRKEIKALIYAQVLGNKDHKDYYFDPGHQIQHISLTAFCQYRLDNSFLGDSDFKKAFELAKKLPCTYHQQEVYKLYCSAHLNTDSPTDLTIAISELDSIVRVDGDFCNFGKVKGEYLYYNKLNPEESQIRLKHAFEYILKNKPYNSLQLYTIGWLLFRVHLENDHFDDALTIVYTLNTGYTPTGLVNFDSDSIFTPALTAQRYYFITLQNYASIHLKKYLKGRNTKDLLLADRLIQLSDSLVSKEIKTFNDEVILSVYQTSNEVYQIAAEIQYQLFRQFSDEKYLNEYLYYVEKNRSRILFRDLTLHSNSQYAKEFEYEKYLRFKIAQFIQQKQQDSLMKYIQLVEKQYDQLSSEQSKDRKIIEKSRFESLETVTKKLNAYEIYVDISMINGKLYTLSLSTDQKTLVRIDPDSSFLKNLNIVTQTQNGEMDIPADQYSTVAYSVYNTLFENLLTNKKKVIYSCSFPFSQMNPEALVTQDSGYHKTYADLNYLISGFVFERIESIYFYDKNNRQSNNYQSITAFLHSDSKSIADGYSYLKELPGNLIEKKIIDQYFDQRKIFIGDKCTKTRFLQPENHDADLLHISVHGYGNTNERNNLYMLFRSESKPDTVFAYELLNIGKTADLVLLTACETAKGKYEDGEGNYSIARYFMHAGSKKVVSSLWNLDDTAGALIVKNFYTNLQSGRDHVTGLHQAKAYLIKEYANFSHPYFWAALI